MIKAIFFDIDGTLLADNGKVLASSKDAIKKAQEKNIYVGVATGRDPVKVKELLGDVGLDMFVTYNGQLVYTPKQTIYAQSFKPEVLEQVTRFADTHNRSINFGTRNVVSGSRLMRLGQSAVVQRLARFIPSKFPVKAMQNVMQVLSFYKKDDHYEKMTILNQPIYQCMMLSPESETELLKTELPDCGFHRSNSFSVDIVPKGGSKLKGIEVFLQHKGIALSEAMVFGDHYNDISMIKGAGVGVAMGNAKRITKETANYVTDTNNHNGIAQALRYYHIIS
ncbi:Cof-type HAD-IIB family hydrolase [Enterococcus sp. MJM12]|uniref:Cof-type HAD-IIB family hydrolase n=1 Tax=Candidatus Enterococcus myersii TaxID=2815322 RepID=A0ABS3H9B5_9ENTE|nr:Cof-type HAD-IIB family hydrolase [Enterococcus sp. MJM12]MBO0450052.1 Cof-type HAD-IIB family hydrolase [Enterococcus sp. MJM12]